MENEVAKESWCVCVCLQPFFTQKTRTIKIRLLFKKLKIVLLT